MIPPVPDSLALAVISHNAGQDKWQTEAMRSHSSPRLMCVARGQGRITVAGLTSGFGPNNLIFIPAKTLYGYEVGPTVFGSMLTIPTAMDTEWPVEPTHLRLRDVMVQKDLATHLDGLERELNSVQPGHTRAALHQLGLLAIFFERQLAAQDREPVKSRSDSAPARLVAAYTGLIERDFHTNAGVADYAAKLGVTPTHLARCCRETCDKTSLALLNDRIFYQACVLLRGTTKPVQTIAADLGFSSPAYFSRVFHAQTGLTPSKFRQNAP